jgi:uncharacterized protein YegL
MEAEVGKGRKERIGVTRLRRQLLFSCAIDVSGSMSGAPIQAAISTLEDLFRSTMADTDKFACCTFGSNVKKLHAAMPKSRIDIDKDVAHISDNAGGLTALWDGVAWAIQAASLEYKNMRDREGDRFDAPVVEVVIITDGHDNSSTKRFEEIHALTQRPGIPNFNLVVVGLGSVDKNALTQLCSPRNCHFHHAQDVPEFKRVLGQVVDQIRLRLDVSSPDGHSHYEWRGRAKDAPAQLRNLAQGGQSRVLQIANNAGRLEDIFQSLRITER